MITLRIREILQEQNKSAYWLAKTTGISQNHVSKMCNGETSMIRFDVLEKICIALGCSISDLFETDNQQLKRLLIYNSKINELTNKSDTE